MARKDYIYYKGEELLLSEWTTLAAKTAEIGKSDGYMRKLKYNTKHKKGGEQVEYREIPELKLTLVKR